MTDKGTQEAKELNAQAKAGSTPSGTAKHSITSGTYNTDIAGITSKNSLEEAKRLNSQSKSGK